MQTPRALALALALGLTAAGAARAQSENPSFNLLNHGASPIVELFVTPAGDARWGHNRLHAPILPGAGFPVRRRIDGNCIFDIRVVFADHRILDRRNLNTCDTDDVAVGEGAAAFAKRAGDPSFRLVNRAAQPVDALFATPAGFGNWGQNRLASPVPPEAARLVAIAPQPDTCLYDLRVVFADHTARERHRTDLCRVTDLPVR
jgi:hypothetical protein